MALIDEVQLDIRAGDGGDGVVRWRHEKFKPKAGPGGGNGGRGGDVYAEVIDDIAYLAYYRFTKKFQAEHGAPGGSLGKHGASGKDLTLRFPRGTILTNLDTGQEIDLADGTEPVLLLQGGQGGLGNEYFKSSTNTTPYEWTPGKPGETARFQVELRLFADVGLIGIPSAGKSTLLNSLTNAQSKVAAYHFTTLEPHLGAFGPYILADIPGLIEGASTGKGLGYQFLRHISRTHMLVHVVACDQEQPLEAYQQIRHELLAYDESLHNKKEIILLSKTDTIEAEEREKIVQLFSEHTHHTIYTYSAYDQESIDNFKSDLSQELIGLVKT